MRNKCLEYRYNTRTCKKNKQIVLVPQENITIEIPTQANQINNFQKAQKKRVSFLTEFIIAHHIISAYMKN